MTSANWIPVFVLPNISLTSTIGCEIAALAPANDPRIVALEQAHPSFKQFNSSFSDNFGARFAPSVLIVNTAAPPAFRDVTALSSFRDLIALSAIIHGRTLELLYPGQSRLLFGETFAIYPWMLDQHYRYVIGNTPALLGVHELSRFKGQSSPAVFRMSLGDNDLDQPLLAELMSRWRRHYEATEPTWTDVALMRSLNMAYHASLLPAGTETTFYDVGRIVSLWVSAFEILVHPGGTGKANREKVFEMIAQVPWILDESKKTLYDTGEKTITKRTLAAWLYQRLNYCRNDFLHGNPVTKSNLTLSTPQRAIFEYAAPLYRATLTAFLPLAFSMQEPAPQDAEACAAYVLDYGNFTRPQKSIEKALLTALDPRLSP